MPTVETCDAMSEFIISSDDNKNSSSNNNLNNG
jgi:hypothetical protein